ncbi:MAG TPA: ATP-binding protein [Candidatus Deferrimicrobium sp.]|nr:ATP-binding protein [Candidatus Deferrimicrobium sp.]
MKETIKNVVQSQKSDLLQFEYGVEREKLSEIDLDISFAIVLSGVRRCGKSTLLHQLMKKIDKYCYFNFEDTRIINFEPEDFQKLNEVLIDEYQQDDYYFFDEIQNVQKWEIFVRSMLDRQKKFIITGSNASLLSKELGTRLTGRHLRYELFPFSFKEMLTFSKQEPNINSFEEYFQKGGFPEYLKYNKTEILQQLLNDIIARDIIVRHKLRDVKTVKEMALYLLTNIGNEFSYNGLKKIFNLGSTNSALSYVSYFEDSYLMFTIPRFDYSLKKQLINPKKVYSIDNGLSNVNSASFSSNRGRMLENVVFLQLRRKYKDIFYFRAENECDFIVKDRDKIISAFQVCYELSEDNKKREFDGLLETLTEFQLESGLILTYNQEDEFKIDNKRILLKPTWKWLIES